MTNENKLSRLAGVLYLIVVVTGIFSLAYVPSQLNVADDPQATFQNIAAHESLFRFGIASFLIEQVAFLLLPLVLFQLFHRVDRNVSIAMVALVVCSVPIALVSVIGRLDVLSLLTEPYYGTVFSPEQLQASAERSLDFYRNGIHVTSLFWGLWLLPFGYLVLKCGFLPRIFGIVLMLGCVGYLMDVFGELLMPHYADTFIARYTSLPGAIGEIGTCLWLLLVGARRPRSQTQTAVGETS